MKNLLINIDEKILEELLAEGGDEMFEVDDKKGVVELKESITKDSWAINESAITYMNRFLAISPTGSFQKNKKPVIRTGEFLIHTSTRTVYKNGKKLNLSPSCYKILEGLLSSKDGTLSRNALIRLLESDSKKNRIVDENNLNQHIRRLKTALGEDKKQPYIKAVYEFGYAWQLDITRR